MFVRIDESRARLRAFLPWIDSVETPQSLSNFLTDSARMHRDGTAVRMIIEVAGELAGVISFEGIDDRHHNAMIGYWIGEAYEGKGWITRATRALCEYGFGVRGLHRVEIRAMPSNRRSRAVPERLGFRREGVLRECSWLYDRHVDMVVYSMLRPAWEARR